MKRRFLWRTMMAWRLFLLVCALGGGLAYAAQEHDPVLEIPSFVADREAVIEGGWIGKVAFTADPFVLKDAEGYHLFVTVAFCKAAENGIWVYVYGVGGRDCLDYIGTIAYAFSTDRGESWEFRITPLVMPGPDEWRSSALETASVLRVQDTLILLYSARGTRNGKPFFQRFQIGSARFELRGQTIREALLNNYNVFVHDPEPLVPYNVTKRNSIDNNTQEPSLLQVDDELWLYYIGLGLRRPGKGMDAPHQKITSINLILQRYDLQGHPVAAAKVVTPPAASNEEIVNITQVVRYDNRFHLYATTVSDGPFHQGEQISYTSSKTGMEFATPTVVLTRIGHKHPYSNWGTMAPTVVVEPDELVLFFTAFEAAEQACDGFLRMGVQQDGPPTRCVYGNVGRAVAAR